jgi:hypothetical protein
MWRRGVLVLALFALAWALVGASGLPTGAAWALRIVAVMLVAAAIAAAYRPAAVGAVERERRLPGGWRRRVGIVNVTQFVVIALVVVVFIAAGRPEFVPPVVCLVVGVHFFPLARLFDQPQYTWTASGLCLVACAGLLVLVTGPGPAPSRVVVGIGATATLLATAGHLAARRT